MVFCGLLIPLCSRPWTKWHYLLKAISVISKEQPNRLAVEDTPIGRQLAQQWKALAKPIRNPNKIAQLAEKLLESEAF